MSPHATIRWLGAGEMRVSFRIRLSDRPDERPLCCDRSSANTATAGFTVTVKRRSRRLEGEVLEVDEKVERLSRVPRIPLELFVVSVDRALGLLHHLARLFKTPSLQVIDQEVPVAGLVEKYRLDDDPFIAQRR